MDESSRARWEPKGSCCLKRQLYMARNLRDTCERPAKRPLYKSHEKGYGLILRGFLPPSPRAFGAGLVVFSTQPWALVARKSFPILG